MSKRRIAPTGRRGGWLSTGAFPRRPRGGASAQDRAMNPALALPLALALPWSPVALDPPDVARAAATVPASTEAVWPLDPTSVLAPFDPPETTWSGGHRGVDLAGSPGAPVRAALPGTVSFASLLAGRGVVVVDHG